MVRSYTRGSEGGVLSEAGFTGWRGFSGWIEAVGLEEVLVGEDFMGGRVGHDDASVHDDGPGEYLLDHVHVVGVGQNCPVERKTLERHDLNVPHDFRHHDCAEDDAHGACAEGNRAI